MSSDTQHYLWLISKKKSTFDGNRIYVETISTICIVLSGPEFSITVFKNKIALSCSVELWLWFVYFQNQRQSFLWFPFATDMSDGLLA